jgi:uncharacterized repeat protein (TIGR04076 family)
MSNNLDEGIKGILKERLGYTEQQLQAIENTPKLVAIIKKFPEFLMKKLIVTCIDTQNCSFNKIGDRYVFNAFGAMIKDESCETPCLWAMSNFVPFSYMVYDRIASGLDPNNMHLDHVVCPDTGCKFGGFGSATFHISVENV